MGRLGGSLSAHTARTQVIAVKRLWLLRHAKSSWDHPGLPDADRPLAPRGRRAAELLAAHLAASDMPNRASSVMLIGHNPGIQDLALGLVTPRSLDSGAGA
jgi:phosphohistidine phosphatase SixA